MYSLVQYDNLEYSIFSTKRVKVIQGSNCVVKYSSGTSYNAELIEKSDSMTYLQELKKKFDGIQPHPKTSTPNTSLDVPYVRLSDISAINTTYSVKSSSSAPSGFTDELNELGSKWPDDDDPIKSDQNISSENPPDNNDLMKSDQNMSTEGPPDNDDSMKSDKNISTEGPSDNDGSMESNQNMSTGGPSDNDDESEKSMVIDMDYDSDNNSLNKSKKISNTSLNNEQEILEKNAEQHIHENVPAKSGLKIIEDIIIPNNSGSNAISIIQSKKFALHHLDNLHKNNESLNDHDIEQHAENRNKVSEQVISSEHKKNDKNYSCNENESPLQTTATNNTQNDSSFHPEQSTKDTDNQTSSVAEDSPSEEKSCISEEDNPLNIQDLTVPSTKKKKKSKKVPSKVHFCPFCRSLQTKFARHLVLKHKTEKEVKNFLFMPSRHLERRRQIDILRKRGDFMHNTKPQLNTGILIVSRRKQKKSKNQAEDYVCCKSCKAFFAKRSIRFHTAKCDRNRKKGEKNIISSSQHLTGYIHSVANDNLRRVVFPVLTDDDVVRAIKYDELIIMYGNKLCDRYTLRHQHDYVRSQLRMLGRIKLEIIKLDKNISEFKDIFRPQHFEKCVKCLKKLAEWDESSGTFKVPFNAQFISTLMKKTAKKLRTECIKSQDDERMKDVENFLLLWEEEIPTRITAKAFNDQMDKRREKKVVLPSKGDIKLLYEYLRNECCNCIAILDSEFDLNVYKDLIKYTLIHVQIFNRRRAGEIERLTLMNYQNKEVLNDNIGTELYKKLSDQTKQFAQQFTRIVIKGKLERTVPVLLNPLAVRSVETILKYRKQAGVPDENNYLFSSFNRSPLAKPYIRACPLLKRFANACGAVIPEALRGTQLRKHVATYTSMLNIEECQVNNLATFMGHHKDIHKSIYRVPVPVTEMTEVSKLLMAAIGEDDGNDDENDDENEDNDQNSDSDSEEENENSQRRTVDTVSNSVEGSSEENDISLETQKKPKTVQRHKLTTTTKIKRRKWTDEEKKAIKKHFGNILKLPKLPSLTECKKVISKYQVLKNRTPEQVFSYINNQRRRN